MPKKKLIYSLDNIPPFLPQKPSFVVLGTMAAINARHIEGHKPPLSPFFYYNDNRNRFWRYMWQIFENNLVPTNLSVQDKMDFCERHGLALCNLLGEMFISENEAKNRTDKVIFKAYTEGRVKTKILNSEFKKALKALPLFFTCYHKDNLQKLLELFLITNALSTDLVNCISFLHTPAMPGRIDVLKQWQNAFTKIQRFRR